MSALDHWANVCEKYRATQEFLEWLACTYGLQLDFANANEGTPLDTRRLLDEFFEVDQKQLEADRRSLLEQQRALNRACDAQEELETRQSRGAYI